MRYGLVIILLTTIIFMVSCQGKAPQSEAGDKVKLDSVTVVRSNPEDSSAQFEQSGMAYREERDAAAQGNPDLQYKLGLKYETGIGVTQNDKEAVKWYRLAAEQGHASAQFNLASCYYRGKGVAQDYQEAVKWYRLSADQGLAIAQYILGARYFDGEGVNQNYQEAYFWVLLARANGSDDLRGMRDYAAEQITARQKAEVQARVSKWLEEH